VGAGGDFRHHSTERAVRLVLADNRLRKNLPVARYERGSSVVAG
jgi:hypothetical protein